VRGSILAVVGLPFTISEILAIGALFGCTAAHQNGRSKTFTFIT
jgi:hypothetical protein